MAYCPHCGARLSDSAKFCANCGGRVAPQENVTQPQSQPQPKPRPQYESKPQPKQKKNGSGRSLLTVLIVLALGGTGYYLYKEKGFGEKLFGNPSTQTQDPALTPSQDPSGDSGQSITPTGNTDPEDGFESLETLTQDELNEYLEALMERTGGALSPGGQGGAPASTGQPASGRMVTVGTVSFLLPDGYSVMARQQLAGGGDTCMICPDDNPNNDRLILKIHPDALKGINGLTSEEVGDMLSAKVNDLAGVLANTDRSGLKLDNEYKVYYDDNADGTYFPHCYSYVYGTAQNGKRTLSYTEATLVNRIIVSGTAIASGQGDLNALSEIYSDIVAAAAE